MAFFPLPLSFLCSLKLFVTEEKAQSFAFLQIQLLVREGRREKEIKNYLL